MLKDNQDYKREEHDAEGWVLTMHCKTSWGTLSYEFLEPG